MSKLIIICGLSFAGKSTLARAIAATFGYAEVDVDETKFHLFGPEAKDEDLTHVDWVRIYAATDQLIGDYLKAGKTVTDASRNFRKSERQHAREIASRQQAEVITIFVDTPEAIARQRLLDNRQTPARRNVTDPDFEEIVQVMEPPTADENPLVFHYGDQLEEWIANNIAASNQVTSGQG